MFEKYSPTELKKIVQAYKSYNTIPKYLTMTKDELVESLYDFFIFKDGKIYRNDDLIKLQNIVNPNHYKFLNDNTTKKEIDTLTKQKSYISKLRKKLLQLEQERYDINATIDMFKVVSERYKTSTLPISNSMKKSLKNDIKENRNQYNRNLEEINDTTKLINNLTNTMLRTGDQDAIDKLKDEKLQHKKEIVENKKKQIEKQNKLQKKTK